MVDEQHKPVDYINRLESMQIDELKDYIVSRLSGHKPSEPPLLNVDESPRDFVENVILFARKADNSILFSNIVTVIKDILCSFLDWERTGKSQERVRQDLALLSHSVFLAGTFHFKACSGPIWGLHMNNIGWGTDGPLGPVDTLIAEAAGRMNDRRAQPARIAHWRSTFEEESDVRKRIIAFANLYRIDPLKAREPAKELLIAWNAGKLPKPLDPPGVIIKYFLHIADICEGRQVPDSLMDIVSEIVFWARSKLSRSKLKEFFEAMKKYPGICGYIAPESPVTVCAVGCDKKQLQSIQSKVKGEKRWSMGVTREQLDESDFHDIQTGVVICILGSPQGLVDSNGWDELLCTLLYRAINRAEPLVNFLVPRDLWDRLGDVVARNSRGDKGELRLTSLATERISCFGLEDTLVEKMSTSVECALKTRDCLLGGSGVVEKTREVVRRAAIWHGDTLYGQVEDVFGRLQFSHAPNLKTDCFRATLSSLSSVHNYVYLEPTTGPFGLDLSDITIQPYYHPLNIGVRWAQ